MYSTEIISSSSMCHRNVQISKRLRNAIHLISRYTILKGQTILPLFSLNYGVNGIMFTQILIEDYSCSMKQNKNQLLYSVNMTFLFV